jgi:hypothetical protein
MKNIACRRDLRFFVGDFLVEQTMLKRTFHFARYRPANPVFTGRMPFSGGVFI